MSRVEVLDLFSAAAGGWSLGLHRAGYRTVAACEVEAWRRAVYSENNPGVKVYDDVRTLTADRLLADLGRLPTFVVGSPPCQDISSANTKGKGVDGERSGLYFEAVRLVGECRPRWFAFENSANLRTRGADAIVAALEAIGYACWPVVVRAGDIDANHERPRAWLIGCDLAQVADPDGVGRHEGWCGRGFRFDVPAATDTCDSAQDGRRPGLSGRRAVAIERLPVEACGDAADTPRIGCISRTRDDQGAGREDHGHESAHGAAPSGARDAADADQARQAHGCVEPGLRQAEIADDGCSARRGPDRQSAGQMGLCAPDCGHADRCGAEWTLEHLADHLRLDDGLSAWLAGTRIQVGDGKGQSAASLAVEAFGDAVIPQIPEAIGRAIQRVEQAMAAVHGRIAA